MRRTNNTAADLTNGTKTFTTGTPTTCTATWLTPTWSIYYVTTDSNDIIQLFGDVNVVPDAGSLKVSNASIFVEKKK